MSQVLTFQDIRNYLDLINQELIDRIQWDDNYTDLQYRDVFSRYVAAIEGNFITWMVAGWMVVNNQNSIVSLKENLYAEVTGNHPGMLRRLAKSINCEPTLQHFSYIEQEIEVIRIFLSKLNKEDVIAFIIIIESTAEVTMALLRRIANHFGKTDNEYIELHAVLDIDHTNASIQTALDELPDMGDITILNNSAQIIMNLFIKIFKP